MKIFSDFENLHFYNLQIFKILHKNEIIHANGIDFTMVK